MKITIFSILRASQLPELYNKYCIKQLHRSQVSQARLGAGLSRDGGQYWLGTRWERGTATSSRTTTTTTTSRPGRWQRSLTLTSGMKSRRIVGNYFKIFTKTIIFCWSQLSVIQTIVYPSLLNAFMFVRNFSNKSDESSNRRRNKNTSNIEETWNVYCIFVILSILIILHCLYFSTEI